MAVNRLLLLYFALFPLNAFSTIKFVNAFPNLKFEKPVAILSPPDGSNRLFVVEQGGKVHVFPNDPGVKKTTIFLNLGNSVGTLGKEEGLLGMAFDPQFKSNGHFYTYFTKYFPRRSVVVRFTLTKHLDNYASLSTEKEIISIRQPFPNHNGGMLAFGPDGKLFIGVGDGGKQGDPSGHGQNRKTLLGNILRLDLTQKDYIPKDNPFMGVDNVKPLIFAYGLKNPKQFSFDSQTGELWVADGGHKKREEISLVKAGDNLGWNKMEGNLPFKNYNPIEAKKLNHPVQSYSRRYGRSITGGFVYRGTQIPSLSGLYLFADFSKGSIWTLKKTGDKKKGRDLYESQLIGELDSPSAFGEDAGREIYVLSFNGSIYKIQKN